MVGSSSSIFVSLYCPLQISTCICFSERHSKLGNNLLLIGLEKRRVVCFSSKKKPGFMDQILDYIEGTLFILEQNCTCLLNHAAEFKNNGCDSKTAILYGKLHLHMTFHLIMSLSPCLSVSYLLSCSLSIPTRS